MEEKRKAGRSLHIHPMSQRQCQAIPSLIVLGIHVMVFVRQVFMDESVSGHIAEHRKIPIPQQKPNNWRNVSASRKPPFPQNLE